MSQNRSGGLWLYVSAIEMRNQKIPEECTSQATARDTASRRSAGEDGRSDAPRAEGATGRPQSRDPVRPTSFNFGMTLDKDRRPVELPAHPGEGSTEPTGLDAWQPDRSACSGAR